MVHWIVRSLSMDQPHWSCITVSNESEKKKTPSRAALQADSEEKWDWEAAAESIDQQEVVK